MRNIGAILVLCVNAPSLAFHRAMAESGVLLLVHGEVTDAEVDMFDREAVFIKEKLVRSQPVLIPKQDLTPTASPLLTLTWAPTTPSPSSSPPLPVQIPVLEKVPNLKVVMEHITTREAAEFVASAPANVAAT